MKFDFKFNIKFVIITLVVALIVVPVLFNFLFMWESGWSRGETSDWFTLYGNIIGGLIGGFFTYLALLLTFKEQKETKKNEMRPRIDIPHQNFEFIDSDILEDYYAPIVIELNNIGGSIAKNIECKLSLPNFGEVVGAISKEQKRLKINMIGLDAITPGHTFQGRSVKILPNDESTVPYIGDIEKECDPEFIGSCIPMILNYEAKTKYFLETNVSTFINYVMRKRNYRFGEFNKDEIFDLDLEIKYSSIEYGEFTDYFRLKWKFTGITMGKTGIKFQYRLLSTLEKSEKIK
ncbi:hypothetical protein ACMX9J_14290 [Priestia sp. RMT2NF4]|uniref:hypothetical protein n=1 Tax=Priestia sp. RMT2NF4 TaxID=3398394 RepID=UPI003A4C653F